MEVIDFKTNFEITTIFQNSEYLYSIGILISLPSCTDIHHQHWIAVVCLLKNNFLCRHCFVWLFRVRIASQTSAVPITFLVSSQPLLVKRKRDFTISKKSQSYLLQILQLIKNTAHHLCQKEMITFCPNFIYIPSSCTESIPTEINP